MQLCGEDILRIDEVTNQPLSKCLLYLSYKADKSLLEELLHKESLKKMN